MLKQQVILEQFSTSEKRRRREEDWKSRGYYSRYWDLSEVGGTEFCLATRLRTHIKKPWPKFDSSDFLFIH